MSPVGSSEVNGSNQGLNGPKKRGETEVKSVVDVVFEQFKCTRKEKEDALRSCDDGEFVSSGTDAMERGRKRKSPLGGLSFHLYLLIAWRLHIHCVFSYCSIPYFTLMFFLFAYKPEQCRGN